MILQVGSTLRNEEFGNLLRYFLGFGILVVVLDLGKIQQEAHRAINTDAIGTVGAARLLEKRLKLRAVLTAVCILLIVVSRDWACWSAY